MYSLVKRVYGSQLSVWLKTRNLPSIGPTRWTSIANQTELAMTTTKQFATVSYVTTPNEDVARQLSRKLVENRLAACVNIIKGVESIYEWKDKIEHDIETLMIIKSHSEKSEELAKFIQSNHPYDCPEVVTLKIDSGSAPYLDWIHKSINKKPSS